MKSIIWGKSGQKLTGEVLAESERLYTVTVTACEHAKDRPLLGKQMDVSKLVAKVIRAPEPTQGVLIDG